MQNIRERLASPSPFEPFEFLSDANIVFAMLYIHVYRPNISLQQENQHSHTDRLANTRIVHGNENLNTEWIYKIVECGVCSCA